MRHRQSCKGDEHRWVAVAYSTNEARGWILGGFVEDEPTVRQFNVYGAYSTIYNHSCADESSQTYSTRVWLSQSTQTTCSLLCPHLLNIFLLSPSAPALQAAKNPRSKKAHSYILRFHRALMLFFLQRRDARPYLVWAPKDDELDGDRLAHYLASEAHWGSPPDGMDRVQSAAYRKDRTRAQAFRNWE